jgi:hypothetical protein
VDQKREFLGIWSPADLIAHRVGWDHANLQAIDEIRIGELPAFYALRDRDWQTYNARLVERYRLDDFDELVVSAEESHRFLIAALEVSTEEEINRDFGVRSGQYRVTIGRLMQAEPSDEEEHLEQLRHL